MLDKQLVPVFMKHFNHTQSTETEWLMWHNGYDLSALEHFLHTEYPDFLANQTVENISSPLFPGTLSNQYFQQIDPTQYQDSYYFPVGIQWWSTLAGLIEKTIDIPKCVLETVDRSHILLFNNREQWGADFWDQTIDRIRSVYPTIPRDRFLVSCNNPDLEHIPSEPLISNQTVEQYTGTWPTHQAMWQSISDSIADQHQRPHRFVCLMRRPNASRWAISAELMEYRLKQQCLMSMIVDTQMIQQNGPVFDVLDHRYYDYVREQSCRQGEFTVGGWSEVQQVYPDTLQLLQQHEAEYPFWIDGDTNALLNPIRDPHTDKFLNSYLHIASETFVNPDQGVCLSEKVFKPIWYMQPFVVFGTPHTLSALADLGYQTFDQWIDQSYDTITDTTERFYSAISSVKKFVDQDTADINRMMVEMLPVLEHNTQVLADNNQNLHTDYTARLAGRHS